MKKFIPLVLTILLFGIIMPSYARYEKVNIISYDSANDTLLKNSNALKKLEMEERKMFYVYNNSVQTSRSINTEGTNVSMFGMDFFHTYSDDIQMYLTMRKELTPATTKYYWDMLNDTKSVTQNALSLGLRDLYLGLLAASRNYDISLRKLGLEEKKFNANKVRLEQGLISQIEFEEAKYHILKAEKDSEGALRALENMKRTLNSFIGAPIDNCYEEFLYNDLRRNLRLQPLEYYIEKALEQRMEIKNKEKEIEIKKLEISILEKNRVHETFVRISKQYSDALRELELLNAQLQQAKLDIENEIKSAYIEIKKEGYNVQTMSDTLRMQIRNYERIQSQYNQGLIPKLIVEEVEIGIDELRNGVDFTIYNYNSKIMNLEEAAGLGPAY
ncbi:UNVERIFIED_CONTAM: outer membrane efflux protein [Acetivibrio alkalicellulosi]